MDLSKEMARLALVQRELRASYTVACICPMGVELAPVEAMLDEIDDTLPTTREQNAYTLGRMGAHKMVIAVMPQVGNDAAAKVATQLLNDFPSLRFAILVGIGGGVPGGSGGADVRLGDIVVSQPSGLSGGVVQYDMGKHLADGKFERTGQLNKPPEVLSANVRKLEAQHRRQGNRISAQLAQMLDKYPAMKEEYSHPGSEHDVLFNTDYVHQRGVTCRDCDTRQMESRIPRPNMEPRIHYGTIGSANALVKDAITREILKQDMNILCVEMEAAGLMSTFPCLVVRGICDYANSHKNKRWQPYAAAVAAGYVKELLALIPVQQVERTAVAKEVTRPRESFH